MVPASMLEKSSWVQVKRTRQCLKVNAIIISMTTATLMTWLMNAAAVTTTVPNEEFIYGKEKLSVSCASTIPKEIVRNANVILKGAQGVKQLFAESTGGNLITILYIGSGSNLKDKIVFCVDRIDSLCIVQVNVSIESQTSTSMILYIKSQK
jgi:hypothetical protein